MNWCEAKFRSSLFEWKPCSWNAPYRGNSSHFSSNKPFPEAGSRPSAPSSCVLCANNSHTLFSHSREKTKFSDGKPFWAKFFCPQMVKKSVFDSTLEEDGTAVSTERNMEIPASMLAPSVATNRT